MSLKQQLQNLLTHAIVTLQQSGTLPTTLDINPQIERARDEKHGDYASNIALPLAKATHLKPRDLAQTIIDSIPPSEIIAKIEIAGPGFINFFITDKALQNVIPEVLSAGNDYGNADFGKGQRIHIEFLSANPNGPLHVGHGRSAAYGACISNLLKKVGYHVHADYYVNDAGRQMRNLGVSIWIRYLQLLDEKVELPENAYRGDYVIDIAKALHDEHKTRFFKSAEAIAKALPDIDPQEKPDAYLDAMVDLANQLLGPADFEIIRQMGLQNSLADIKQDLAEFNVHYDEWFLESRLFSSDMLDAGIKLLKDHDTVYEKDGALWFRATALGDEKDRVLIRANGQPTYFASDVAYHLYKYNQDYDKIIDVFGADHHGYVPRIQAFLKGLGKDPDKLTVLLVQFAILYRGKERVSMSTREGSFVTLRELRNEVGNDAARYFYIMRKPEQHLDFDLELAKSESNDNPVYYIQYAHARICSVWRQLEQANVLFDEEQGKKNLSLLESTHEKQLLGDLIRFPEIIETAAKHYEPHTLAYFLHELANHFHSYYNACKFIVDDSALRNARLCLIAATAQVLKNGLILLGLSAPESM